MYYYYRGKIAVHLVGAIREAYFEIDSLIDCHKIRLSSIYVDYTHYALNSPRQHPLHIDKITVNLSYCTNYLNLFFYLSQTSYVLLRLLICNNSSCINFRNKEEKIISYIVLKTNNKNNCKKIIYLYFY